MDVRGVGPSLSTRHTMEDGLILLLLIPSTVAVACSGVCVCRIQA